jgi:hypothetical protein
VAARGGRTLSVVCPPRAGNRTRLVLATRAPRRSAGQVVAADGEKETGKGTRLRLRVALEHDGVAQHVLVYEPTPGWYTSRRATTLAEVLRRRLAEYPPGRRVEVMVNPSQPDEVYLTAGQIPTSELRLVLLMLAGVGLFAFVLWLTN